MALNNKTVLLAAAGLTVAAVAVRAKALPAIALPATNGTRAFTKFDALLLVQRYDVQYYRGWFSQNGRSHKDVMAIFAVESGFDPLAYNGAWGIGQMLATTAADFGVLNPTQLFKPEIAIKATMDYLKWSHGYLTNSLGRTPSRDEWIGAYNYGVGNVSKGRIPYAYLLKWQALRAFV